MQHNLDLLNNSTSFFREAISYAERDDPDAAQWKFAIINLVQAMELALKEALRRLHPAFVYDDVDAPNTEKTISISKAIVRLRNKHIGNFSITDKEALQFKAAIKLRNQFVHYECTYQTEHVEAKFASTFVFMLFFYEEHLGLSRDQIISRKQYTAILSLKKTKEELLRKVQEQIKEQDEGHVWRCPDCIEDTFVVQDQKCRLCGFEEKVLGCPNCGQDILESDLKDISELFDSSIEEGRAVFYNKYGYEHDACINCYDTVRQDIRGKRYAQYADQMDEEYYYTTRMK